MLGHGALNFYSLVPSFDFGEADLIELLIKLSYQLFFKSVFHFFAMHFSGKKNITKNVIDDSFPNRQGITWHVNEGQFGPWPQNSASQCWPDPRHLKSYNLVQRACKQLLTENCIFWNWAASPWIPCSRSRLCCCSEMCVVAHGRSITAFGRRNGAIFTTSGLLPENGLLAKGPCGSQALGVHGGGGGVVAKSCPTLTTLWTVARQLLCPWDSPGRNTGMGGQVFMSLPN